jgi:asparagine synthase (glutamine-hydrolysing)
VLSLRLHLWDLCSIRWIWTEDRWTNGNSWLRPVSTPALRTRLVHDQSGRAAFVIQERSEASLTADHEPSQVNDVHTVVARVHASSGEYLTVLLEPGGVRLTAGPFGTAPLYLAQRRDLLLGSWHLPDVRALIRPDELLNRAVTRRLTRQARYTTDTVLSGVRRLTERATATVTHAGLTVAYPDPAEHVLHPRRVRPGADVVDAFGELLTQIMVRTAVASGPAGVELSGGADSATVALALAPMHQQPVHSYGLVLDGEVGEQQRERRAALVEHFGPIDAAVDACTHPPFAPTGVRGLGMAHDPTSAYYREAFDALRDAAQAGGTRLICTGLGGDELCAHHPDEYVAGPLAAEIPAWLGLVARAALADIDVNLAPVAPITQPTLMAFGTHNPAYLAAGICRYRPWRTPSWCASVSSCRWSGGQGSGCCAKACVGPACPPRSPTHPNPRRSQNSCRRACAATDCHCLAPC